MCAYAHLHAPICLLYIENVDKELVAIEAEDPDVVYEEEQQQFVGEDQEQELEQELTNFVDTQGKHRFIYPRVLHKFKFGASTGAW